MDQNNDLISQTKLRLPRWLLVGIAVNIIVVIIAMSVAPTLQGEAMMAMMLFYVPSLWFFSLITSKSSLYFEGFYIIIFLLPTFITYFCLGALLSQPVVFSKFIWRVKKFIFAGIALIATLVFYNSSDAIQNYVIQNISKDSKCFLISIIRDRELSSCYYNQAWKENNEAHCAKVKYYQDSCYKDLAINKKEPTICLALSDESVLRCLVESGAEANLCAKANIDKFDLNSCYERVGASRGDINACFNIAQGSRNKCFSAVAIAIGDQEYCHWDAGQNRGQGDDCLYRIFYNKLKEAASKQDISICDQLQDSKLSPAKCRAEYAQELKDFLLQEEGIKAWEEWQRIRQK